MYHRKRLFRIQTQQANRCQYNKNMTRPVVLTREVLTQEKPKTISNLRISNPDRVHWPRLVTKSERTTGSPNYSKLPSQQRILWEKLTKKLAPQHCPPKSFQSQDHASMNRTLYVFHHSCIFTEATSMTTSKRNRRLILLFKLKTGEKS